MSGKTKVKMTSFMSGKGYSYSPGDVVELSASEAERVVSVGGAVAYVEEKATGEGSENAGEQA